METAWPVARSFGAKLFAIVFAVLLLNFGALGWLSVRLHRQHLEAESLRAARRMNDVIARSIGYTMLRNDRDGIRLAIESVGRDPAIRRISISNYLGEVKFAAVKASIANERTLTVTTPIANTPTCAQAACHAHPETQKTLGVLEANISLADSDASLATAGRQFTGLSALAILLTLGSISAAAYRFVRPVAGLRGATDAIARGELGVQIPIRSNDELGALARSFNIMSTQLLEARNESLMWAHTLEERVEEKTQKLQAADRQMLQAEKLTSLGKLAAVVAHEINNPLSGILTYARLMRKWIDRGDLLERHAAEMHDSLEVIESESRRCGEIVRNLLTFARVSPMNISDVDVNAVVRITLKIIEHKLELGNIAVSLDLAPDLPRMRGDAGQLEQLLLALVMNAIDAMPHDGNLQIATRPADNEAGIVICVADDGTGIDPELLPRLFDPFVTTKEEGKGVGLGLAISRSVVERHKGHIRVESEPGRGTKFIVEFPATPILKTLPQPEPLEVLA
jgi:two-component system NtrC family sensor kinase